MRKPTTRAHTIDEEGVLGILPHVVARRMRAAAWRRLRSISKTRARAAWKIAKARV